MYDGVAHIIYMRVGWGVGEGEETESKVISTVLLTM